MPGETDGARAAVALVRQVGDVVATALPEPAATVARVISAALKFAEDLIARGIDPVTHIERLHTVDPMLADTEAAWAEALRKRFEAQ